jgi:hypothetical protein
VKTWSYGINSYNKTAFYYLEIAPWYILFIDWFSNQIWSLIPAIPLPAISMVDSDGNKTNWKEEYNNLNDLYYCRIHAPIFAKMNEKKKTINMPISYDKLKENHPEDIEFFIKEQKLCEEIED